MKSEREKRKSNLETFKEELKRYTRQVLRTFSCQTVRFRMQEERERRHGQKQRDKDVKSTRFPPPSSSSQHSDIISK